MVRNNNLQENNQDQNGLFDIMSEGLHEMVVGLQQFATGEPSQNDLDPDPRKKPEVEPEKMPDEDPGKDNEPKPGDGDDDDDDDDAPYLEPSIGDDPDEIRTKTTVFTNGN